VEGVNAHALNAKSHILGAMGGLTASLRFFITLKELSSLNLMNCTCYTVCGDLSFHIVYIVESWLDDPVLDNELTISSYSLGGGGLLHIRDLSHNAMLMDNMELPLHN